MDSASGKVKRSVSRIRLDFVFSSQASLRWRPKRNKIIQLVCWTEKTRAQEST